MKKPAKKLTMEEIAALVQQYAQEDVQVERLKARLASALVKTKDVFKARIEPFADAKKATLAALRAWAKSAKDHFETKRSIEFLHGVIGFRKTPYAVTVAETDAASINQIVAAGLKKKYVRVVEELDREALLKDRETKTEAEWADLGISFSQDDEFFIDVKATPAELPKA